MAVKIYHGDILFTPSADRLEIHENSYIIVEDGVVSQICEKIPEQYQGADSPYRFRAVHTVLRVHEDQKKPE